MKWLKEHKNNPVYWKVALFMILTGARVGEACGICWGAVDLKKELARVIRGLGWNYKTKRPHLEEATKPSSSIRLLLLSDELLTVLREMKLESKNKSGLLFYGSVRRSS